MIIIYSVNEIPIRLTTERWNHITKRHPEMETEKERILETLQHPDFIQEGDFGTSLAVKYYEKTPLTSKYLVVVYKEEKDKNDGFILTAYFANKILESRRIIWKH